MSNGDNVSTTASVVAATTHGLVRCAIYARYSSDNQRQASIEDQIRNCRTLAASMGWKVLDEHLYQDEEKTGTTVHGRTAFQVLIAAAKQKHKPFERVLIDDVSRFARQKADSFRYIDVLTFHQVYVSFVEDGLDSAQPWFEEAFHNKAAQAANYSKSMGHKIRRGREGRFLAGYNPGGACYGYIGVADEDYTRKGLHGRPAVKGMLQEIFPEQAAIVHRIFAAYASGMSLKRIAEMLNAEGVPPSQKPRSKKRAAWCATAIQVILRNRRYIGQVTWRTTKQEQDPETGRYVRRALPESEWLKREMPNLRIISDDLWAAVQDQFKRVTFGIGSKRLGGMSRTESSRKYLFSGLLRCGLCGGNVRIITSQPATYGCGAYRDGAGCSNKRTIRTETIESTFLKCLTHKLESPDLLDDLAEALTAHLNSAKGKALQDDAVAARDRRSMEETSGTLRIQRDNLIRAIREMGHSRGLLEELKQVEQRLDRIDKELEALSQPPIVEVTESEMRTFLRERAVTLLEILKQSPEMVRNALQRRITTLTLTPFSDERGRGYEVSGDVGLISSPDNVLLTNQVHSIGQQYNIPIRYEWLDTRRSGKLPMAA